MILKPGLKGGPLVGHPRSLLAIGSRPSGHGRQASRRFAGAVTRPAPASPGTGTGAGARGLGPLDALSQGSVAEPGQPASAHPPSLASAGAHPGEVLRAG